MRLMLDTNLWSSLGDDQAAADFDAFLIESDATVQVPPSMLLEVVLIPDEAARRRIVQCMARGRRRTRLPTEADSFGNEVCRQIYERRPHWVRQIPDSGRAAQLRTFWQKTVWREAMSDSQRQHEYQVGQATTRDVVNARQREVRQSLLETQYELGSLLSLEATDDSVFPVLPGWDGSPLAAWRVNLAFFWWYQLFVVEPRSQWTGEDSTHSDWVKLSVDLRRLRANPSDFTHMWLFEIDAIDVPRNWLNWAVDMAQSSMKVGSGNAADAQHSAYLLDADIFLTADVRFAKVLERVREDAPFRFATTVTVNGDRSIPTLERIRSALSC